MSKRKASNELDPDRKHQKEYTTHSIPQQIQPVTTANQFDINIKSAQPVFVNVLSFLEPTSIGKLRETSKSNSKSKEIQLANWLSILSKFEEFQNLIQIVDFFFYNKDESLPMDHYHRELKVIFQKLMSPLYTPTRKFEGHDYWHDTDVSFSGEPPEKVKMLYDKIKLNLVQQFLKLFSDPKDRLLIRYELLYFKIHEKPSFYDSEED